MLINKVLNYILENKMITKGDKVLIALSGGPDSVAMTHILYQLQSKLDFTCYAAHVNHCLRGEEADKDEAYASDLCKSLNIPFYSKRIDINALAKARSISHEMAGREARYEFFNNLRVKLKLDKIALAHNANDQAETILMRIMRGTGLEGLGGIQAVREGVIIRPILSITREEIEEYISSNSLQPRVDKTNLQDIYTRNKIRLKLIPYMKENFNEEIISALCRLGELVEADNEYLQLEVENKYQELSRQVGGRVYLSTDTFNLHISLLRRVIKKACGSVKGNELNINKQHIDSIIELQSLGTGKAITLPEGIRAINEYGEIYFTKIEDKRNKINKIQDNSKECNELIIKLVDIMDELQRGAVNFYSQRYKASLTLKLIEKETDINPKSFRNIKFFDFHKIKGDISLRSRKEGDRFNPLGIKGSKKIKDVFIDLKIPREKREELPLLCFGEDIAWIVGYRISDKFKVDEKTTKILQINIEREEKK
ncbi:tRNA lysidine(34) synthetase TilS [Alloiococcus sp. CFN-8]|uniref:tRNA lysidine(34) synthetase TilS n=1 Tax=Alloiococcus sp. CFN-8 TaxID=3416081 RepID=UPI003CEFF05B